jgi:hypothetical protein
MIAVATIYSLCSLCGPSAKRCARYNPNCKVPKSYTNSEKEHARSVSLWRNGIFVLKTKEGDTHTKVHRVSGMHSLTETAMMKYFDADEWIV